MKYFCESSITSSVTYKWLHNGTVVKEGISPILNITNAGWNVIGEYYCMVTANNVSVNSNTGYLELTVSGPSKLY